MTDTTWQAPGPTLETARLILRPTAISDFDHWCAFQADAETTRFLGGPKTPEETWRIMMACAGAWTLGGVSFFSVIEKATGLWIGRIGPWEPLNWPGHEVGWSLHPDAVGKGYALEAAVASMDYGFDVLGWDDIIHTIAPGNLASARLAARLGSVNRGPVRLPSPLQDTEVEAWGQTRAEWAVNRTHFAA